MNNENIESPCISVCKSDPVTDFCYGCGRTTKDKKMWKDPDTADEWKKYIGDSGLTFGIDNFGKSAPYKKIYEYFNLTSEHIVKLTSKMVKN